MIVLKVSLLKYQIKRFLKLQYSYKIAGQIKTNISFRLIQIKFIFIKIVDKFKFNIFFTYQYINTSSSNNQQKTNIMVLKNNDVPYMHQNQIYSAVQLPVPQTQRKATDVCCAIIGIIFGLVLFIIALCVYNHANLAQVNYPSDNQGNICMNLYDSNGQNYPFVYFNDISDPLNTRHCVKECPLQGIRPSCYNCTISYYPNYPSSNSLGQYCLPQDQGQKNQLLYNANLFERWNSQKAIDYLLIGLGISIGIALITMILMLFLPRIIIWVIIILAIALLIVTAVVFILNNHTTLQKASGWAILFGILCLIFLLVFLFYLIFHRKRILIAGAFLQHASQFLKKHPLMFLYIPLFVILTFLFGLLTMFEYFAFSSISQPTFSKDSMFYVINRPPFWIFLLVIQTIWGFSFLRDGFNYIISSSAALYYFQNEANCIQPMKNCMCLNLGSVIGGSFLNGFFYFPSLIVNLICPRADCCCCNLFDLIRTDVYSYIGLTGNSYCPSVRQCQYLCYRSNVCRQNQSTNAIISLASRIFISLASVLIVYWIARDNLVEQKIPPYLLLGIFFIGIYISIYFIDILLNASEGLMIAFLAEIQLDQHGYKELSICKKQLKDLINELQVQQGKRQNRPW